MVERLDGVREYQEGFILELDEREVPFESGRTERRVILRAFTSPNGEEFDFNLRKVEIDVRDFLAHVKYSAPWLLEPEPDEL